MLKSIFLKYKHTRHTVKKHMDPMNQWKFGKKRLAEKGATAKYWKTVEMNLLLLCRLLRAQRTGDWRMTLNTCTDLCSWFFAFGHTNYARWMPVILHDMKHLPEIHPSVHDSFIQGKFVFQRSNKKFSLMALDQSQEHSIKFLKEDGGT